MILIDKIQFEECLAHLKAKLRTSNMEPDIEILNWLRSECEEALTGYLIDEQKIEIKIRELEIEKIKYNSFEEFDEVVARSNQVFRLEWIFQISDNIVSEKSTYETSLLQMSIKDQLKAVRSSMGTFLLSKHMDLNDEDEDFSNFHTN